MIQIVLQAISALFSMISSLVIVNIFNSIDDKSRAAAIIIFAILNCFTHIIKLCYTYSVDGYGADFGGDGSENNLTMSKTAAKTASIGFVDCVFDIVTGIALINGIDFAAFDSTSALVAVGTFIGFSEELVELLLDLLINAADKAADGVENGVMVISIIESLAALIEIIISLYLIGLVTNDAVFMGLGITVLLLTGCMFCCCSLGWICCNDMNELYTICVWMCIMFTYVFKCKCR
eukprot:529280_1